MNQIHIYIQEVIQGERIGFQTSPLHRDLILDIRSELQGLNCPIGELVTRVAFSKGQVILTLATPIRGARSGDYKAAWIIYPQDSLFTIAESKCVPDLMEKLRQQLNDPRPDYESLRDYCFSQSMDSPLAPRITSANNKNLAYRYYQDATDLARYVSLLAQTEYAKYSAVYFLPPHIQPSIGINLSQNPLIEHVVVAPPPEPSLRGASLEIELSSSSRPQTFNSPLRLQKEMEFKCIYKIHPYKDIVRSEKAKDGLELTLPQETDWLKELDLNNITVCFAGMKIDQVPPLVNGASPREDYSKPEWEQGLTIEFKHSDYEGEELRLMPLDQIPTTYKFTKRRISKAFFSEYNPSNYNIKIDGKLLQEAWKDQDWWKCQHQIVFTDSEERSSKPQSIDLTNTKQLQRLKTISPIISTPLYPILGGAQKKKNDDAKECTSKGKSSNEDVTMREDMKKCKYMILGLGTLLFLSILGSIYLYFFANQSSEASRQESSSQRSVDSGVDEQKSSKIPINNTDTISQINNENPISEEGSNMEKYRILNQKSWSKSHLDKISEGLFDYLKAGELMSVKDKLDPLINEAEKAGAETSQAQKLLGAIKQQERKLFSSTEAESCVSFESIDTEKYIELLKKSSHLRDVAGKKSGGKKREVSRSTPNTQQKKSNNNER